jgi:nitroreductase
MAWIIAQDSSAAGGAKTAIPFRTEMPVSAGSIAFSAFVTVLVLVALVAVMVYARRRGWDGRWRSGTMSGKRLVSEEGIEICSTRRVSMATTAHVVQYRGHGYLIVESARGVSITVSPLGALAVESGEAP